MFQPTKSLLVASLLLGVASTSTVAAEREDVRKAINLVSSVKMPFPEGLGHEKISEGPDWTKGDLLHANRVKLELFTRFGVLRG